MENRIQGGLDILYREAKYSKKRTWKNYEKLKARARDHVEACGGKWAEYQQAVCCEIAERLRPRL